MLNSNLYADGESNMQQISDIYFIFMPSIL